MGHSHFLSAKSDSVKINLYSNTQTGHDEYSLLDLYSGFFLLLVPYSENLLLGRVASNANKTSDVPKLDVDSKPFWFSCLI